MATEATERFKVELDLLLAMYPESLTFSPQSRELRYSYCSDQTASGALLLLRLPDTYPVNGFPEVISATGYGKEDLRSATKAAFTTVDVPPGEEVLDALLLAFEDLVLSHAHSCQSADIPAQSRSETGDRKTPASRTVIIWLHHLLNTNKRKLALNPSCSSGRVSGVTKPGYPGVLIFSGESSAVESHVTELRTQRWQAFQVRYDTDDRHDGGIASNIWQFRHGAGIREVESMSDVAQSIVDAQLREIFLGSIGVK
ncbi:hypothetical protein GGR50DRAFT_88823 [Xylaria sp. CBS 124048]|nr:hypothetical protein GGR50DRAFT_88823 [Xylaria sp. CBS 124048]